MKKTNNKKKQPNIQEKLNIMYTNADQLTKKKKQELIEVVTKTRPHIIAICEVKPKNWKNERLIQDYAIQGYSEPHQTNALNRVGRGIIILTHESIKDLVVDVQIASEFQEACMIEIKLKGNDVLLFGCLYRSPTSTPSSGKNNAELNRLLKETVTNKKYTHICIVGDFNYKDINWENWSTPHDDIKEDEKFLEALRDTFLFQHVDEPTRARGTDEPSLIDLILTNEEEQVSNITYLAPLGRSDHSVLSFTFDCYFEPEAAAERYNYHKADYEGMKRHLEYTNWAADFNTKAELLDANGCWNTLREKLLDLRSRYVPCNKERRCYGRNGKFAINQQIQSEIQNKRRLHRKWIRSIGTWTEERSRLEYVNARNLVNRKITQVKRRLEERICEQAKKSPKRFWKHVRSSMKTKSGISPLLRNPLDKSSLRFTDEDKADILQDQFCSVFTQEPDGNLPEFDARTDSKVEFDLTLEMVEKELKSLNQNKPLGPDEIHQMMLKELADYLATPLFTVMTYEEGKLPDDWKVAHVSPIYKKGCKNQAVNYRPVSLTSVACRLMERILKDQIMKHLTNEKLLSNKQHGFMPNRSTVTQLLSYLDKCADSISNNKVVDVVYFDFAKAFDTVPHRRLLKKLEAYGIKGLELDWIKSFLSDRYQYVRVNGKLSKRCRVLSGVPQGSVLGPLLFVIYINDLPEVTNAEMFLFADDTKLVEEINSVQDAQKLQQDIDAMERWSEDWLLKFHPDKCHVLTLGKFWNIKHAHPYEIDGSILEHVDQEKDLGVIIDSGLTFDEHIFSKIKKANSIVGLISRSFEFLSPEMFRTLFIAFVRPHLEYAHIVWSPKLVKHINALEGVQRRATRLVGCYRNHLYEDRLRLMKLPTLKIRRQIGDMVEVYKHLHVYDESSKSRKFIFRKRPQRQHNQELQRNFADDGVRGYQTNSLYYRSIEPWNKLNEDVVAAPSVTDFKDKLITEWHDKLYKL